MQLDGKVAYISGAGGGIGQALAARFLEAGARLLVTDRNGETLEDLRVKLGAGEDRVMARVGDVTDAAFLSAIVGEAVARWGGLHAAVNNAGFFAAYCDLVEIEEQLARQVMEVDYWGVFHAMRVQVPAMLASGGGSIVNVSSGAGLLGFPLGGAYCAAKHAVVGLTRASALDYGKRGVRVNALCPGMVRTPPLEADLAKPYMAELAVRMHPIGRVGEPHEIADAALWLCSDASSFITGVALPVDGGFSAQ